MIRRRTRPLIDPYATVSTHGDWFQSYDRALPWAKEGACWGRDDVDFFVDGPVRGKPALALCAECPVRAECLEHALRFDERGIWGGTFYSERLKMKAPLSTTQTA